MRSLLVFGAGGHRLGVEVAQVAGVGRPDDFRPDPALPAPLIGRLTTAEGQIPVVDLGALLDCGDRWDGSGLIIAATTDVGPLGFAVDRVEDIVAVPDDVIASLPALIQATLRGWLIRKAARLDDQVLLLVDLGRVYTSDEVNRFYEAIQASEQDPASGPPPAGMDVHYGRDCAWLKHN
jgi:purine-binding chemotaxis protein CheW